MKKTDWLTSNGCPASRDGSRGESRRRGRASRPSDGKVTLIKGDKVVQLTIGSNVMLINGVAVNMDVAAEIVDPGRTMLPFRQLWNIYDLSGIFALVADRSLRVLSFPSRFVQVVNPGYPFFDCIV
ncbi:MAG: copper amine oxidase N-terminal domain-containing protein [Bacillota bacterium]